MDKYNIVKLKEEDDEIIRRLANYFKVSKADVVRILAYEKARELGLVTD